MALLTEKEITIEGTGCNIELYAEYRDGQISDIYGLLDIDGQRLGQSPGILLYDGIKESFTSYCIALQHVLTPDLSRELFNNLNRLIKG